MTIPHYSKVGLGPVHLISKLVNGIISGDPLFIIEEKNVSCFDIGEVPRSPGK